MGPIYGGGGYTSNRPLEEKKYAIGIEEARLIDSMNLIWVL
jgi:hypothetical protein